jgi:hypothetical protein
VRVTPRLLLSPDDTVVLGTPAGTGADLGAGNLVFSQNFRVGVARYGNDGAHIVSRTSSGGAAAMVRHVAIADDGVLITGTFATPGPDQTFTLEGCESLRSQRSAFLARLGRDFRCAEVLHVEGDKDAVNGAAVALDPETKLVTWILTTSEPFQFGPKRVEPIAPETVVIASLNSSGVPERIELRAPLEAMEVEVVGAARVSGGLIVATNYGGLFDSHAARVEYIEDQGPSKVIDLKGPGEQRIFATDVRDGRVLIGGSFDQQLELGGQKFETGPGEIDGYVGAYGTSLSHVLAVQRVAGSGHARVTAIAWDGRGGFYAAGDAVGAQVVGDAKFGSGGSRDVFVGHFDANAHPLWIKSFPAPGVQTVAAMVVGADTLHLLVLARDEVDFGLGPAFGTLVQPAALKMGQLVLLGLVP